MLYWMGWMRQIRLLFLSSFYEAVIVHIYVVSLTTMQSKKLRKIGNIFHQMSEGALLQ